MFRDELASDVPIFVDLEEFGEYREVDGVIMRCQVMHTSLVSSNRKTEVYPRLEGDYMTLYFDSGVYIKKRRRLPRVNEWCHVNGVRFSVLSCVDEHGICKLVLSSYRQPVPRR